MRKRSLLPDVVKCYPSIRLFRPIIASLILFCGSPILAGGSGGVVLDNSFGHAGALPGPKFMIPASLGKQIGGNLFQSFSQFNLNNTQSATFTGPSNVQNILSRVTGGSSSSIDGKVSSQIQGANLFFLNPAGVMFGPNAQLDVSGSVAVSTANYVKMVDGGKFNTSLGGGDVLTSAPVSAFGFLNNAPAPVAIAGQNSFEFFQIIPGPAFATLSPEKSLSIISGDIQLHGGYITGAGAGVNLISVRSAGEAQLDITKLNTAIDVAQFSTMGDIRLTGFSLIDTSGPSGGPVSIYAGNIRLDHSVLSSNTSGSVPGGGINIVASANLGIIGDNVFPFNISTETTGLGRAGDINASAGSITLNSGKMGSDTSGTELNSGDGGDINLRAARVILESDAMVSAATTGEGNAGNVTIAVDTLQVNDSFNALDTSTNANGNGGDISVTARSITLESARFVAETLDAGDGGTISVTADTLTLIGTAHETKTSFDADTFGRGMGGNINVTATSLILDRGAFMTDNFDIGNGGNINITAESVSLGNNAAISAASDGSGDGGTVNMMTNVLQLDSAVISTTAFSTGAGGNVTVTADNLQLADRGRIASSTNASGNAGDVLVNASSMILDGTGGQLGETGIFAASRLGIRGSAGRGGSVVVSGNQLLLENGGAISTSSSNAAPAGSVQLTLGTLAIESDSSISSANRGTGPAGGVIVSTSGAVTLKKGGKISTSSNRAKGGDITLSCNGVVKLKSESSITAAAGTDGGNITITAPDLVYIADSSITATAGTHGGGTGGNITIDPRFIVLRNSRLDASAIGAGGNITLRSDFLFKQNTSLDVTGTLSSGTVTVTAPELDLGAELITLPSSLVDVGTQLQERCTALLQQDFSSFIIVGRGGTEPPPDEPQPAF
jgi:filamentous hemagglutinin family protein